jgi:hypothetical protein
MDTSRLTQGQMTVGIGGIVLIISLFLSWVSFLGLSASAFDAFSGMDLVMLVVGLVAVTFAGSAATGTARRLPANADLIVAALGFVVMGWALGWDLESGDAGIGAWLALPAGAAIGFGGLRADAGFGRR